MLILVGCNYNYNLQADFNKFKSQFLPEVFELFPDLNVAKSSEISVGFLAGYEFLGYISANILYEYNDEKSFAKTLIDIEENAIAIYSSNDTCLMSVFNFEKGVVYDCEEGRCPVHNEYVSPYILTADPDRNKKLSNTVQYYVLDCREGWYIKDDSLKGVVGNRTEYLRSRTYQHGFSTGAVVDTENLKIVYWVFVW